MQMPSGNKIIGYLGSEHINLNIYISEKTITQGLCGSFDGDYSNDIYNRFTSQSSGTIIDGKIENSTAASWRYVIYTQKKGPLNVTE